MKNTRHPIEIRINATLADPHRAPALSPAGVLQAAARLFEGLIRLRSWCYRKGLLKIHRLPCSVISIGNITSGGTGKTPMTLHVAKLLRQSGLRVVIISRGYKGEAEKTGGVVSDGKNLCMTAQAAGDEPFMMARFLGDVPVLVGKNRVNSCRLAISRFSPDIILLDDGFQHRRLHRDIDIVLLDSARPFGNGFMLPRGSLREAPDALSRASAIVFTRWRDDLPGPASLLPASAGSKPVFFSRHIPYIHDVTGPSPAGHGQKNEDLSLLKNARVFAFSAIADNGDFHRVLTNLGCRITGTAEFGDHHAYSPGEIDDIKRKAKTGGAEFLVTTQKDFPKLPQESSWPMPLVVLGVLPSFTGGENDFDGFLEKAVKKIRRPQMGQP